MKLAILHDDFSISGGGEKLVALLAKGLREKGIKTDIITFDISEDTKKIIPKEVKIETIIDKKIRYCNDAIKRCLFSGLHLADKYDFFIFSGHASLSAAENNKPNILYAHNVLEPEPVAGPKRERARQEEIPAIFSRFRDLAVRLLKKALPYRVVNIMKWLRFLLTNRSNKILIKNKKKKSILLSHVKHIKTERQNLNDIAKIMTNSDNVKNKIKNRYNREATVVYPPIETSKFKYKKHKDYWISVSRIVPLKRIELQVKAFFRLPGEKLYIIGHHENRESVRALKKIKTPNIIFLGTISEEELIRRLSECKGFIFTAKDEDFGMSPVEAMASGKPVIAPNEGGCKETIVNNETGVLIDDINPDKIIHAIRKINKELKQNPDKYRDACVEQAKKFDIEIFINSVIGEIGKKE